MDGSLTSKPAELKERRANLTAGTASDPNDGLWGHIQRVNAWGAVSGTLSATVSIDDLVSGQPLTATIAVNQTADAKGIFGFYPTSPEISLAAVRAALADLANSVEQVLNQLTAAQSAQAAARQALQAALTQQNTLLNTSDHQGLAQVEAAISAQNQALTNAVAAATGQSELLFKQMQAQASAGLLNMQAHDQQAQTLVQDQLAQAVNWISTATTRLQLSVASQLQQCGQLKTQHQQAMAQEQVAWSHTVANRAQVWEAQAAQAFRTVRSAIQHYLLEKSITVLNILSFALTPICPPLAGALFTLGRAASFANAGLYLYEGNYFAGTMYLVCAAMPNPNEAMWDCIEGVAGKLSGLAARTVSEISGAVTEFKGLVLRVLQAAKGEGAEAVQNEITSLSQLLPEHFATEYGQAVFYAGRDGLNRAAAVASGGTTISGTVGGRALDRLVDWSTLTIEESRSIAAPYSKWFAEEASGPVRAWTGGASVESVFRQTELPALLRNIKVTQITIMDALNTAKVRTIYI